jgi:4-hydroxybenzoyl-CoA reductase subunit beta
MLAKHDGEVKIVAGGTDLLPSMKQKLFAPAFVLDLRSVRELHGIRSAPGEGVEIGALTTLSVIEHSRVIERDYRVLHEAVKTVASPVLRNMGTIGGNICLDTRCLWYNQSLLWRQSCGFCLKKDGDLCHVAPGGKFCWATFSGDTPPALLCLGAEIEVAGPDGVRRTPLSQFYVNDGIVRLNLSPQEIVTRVFLPEATAGWRGSYQKLRVRGSIDYPLAGVAVALKMSSGRVEDARVAITAVNPAPHLLQDVDARLIGIVPNEESAENVGELAASTAKPLTTSALTPEYRREMVRVFAKRAVLAAAKN